MITGLLHVVLRFLMSFSMIVSLSNAQKKGTSGLNGWKPLANTLVSTQVYICMAPEPWIFTEEGLEDFRT